jgi:hypothetical protein
MGKLLDDMGATATKSHHADPHPLDLGLRILAQE